MALLVLVYMVFSRNSCNYSAYYYITTCHGKLWPSGTSICSQSKFMTAIRFAIKLQLAVPCGTTVTGAIAPRIVGVELETVDVV